MRGGGDGKPRWWLAHELIVVFGAVGLTVVLVVLKGKERPGIMATSVAGGFFMGTAFAAAGGFFVDTMSLGAASWSSSGAAS